MFQRNKILSLVLLVSLFLRLYFDNPDNFCDLAVYYEAGKKMLLNHTVYDVPGHFQYKYAPWLSLLFGYLISPYEFDSVKHVFHFWSLMAWIFYTFWISGQIRSKVSVPFILLLFFINPLAIELQLGQINLWALASFTAMYVMLKKRTLIGEFWAGVLFCFAFSVKLSLLIAIPYLIFRRHWTVLLSSIFTYLVLGFGILSLTSGVDFTISEHLAWVTSLTKSSKELLGNGYNVSILGVLIKASISLQVATLIWGAFLGGFVLLQWKWRKGSPLFQLGFQAASMVLLSPIAWKYWSLYFIPAFFLQSDAWMEYVMRSKKAQYLGLLGISTVILSFQSNWHIVDEGLKTFWFLLIVLGLLVNESQRGDVVAD